MKNDPYGKDNQMKILNIWNEQLEVFLQSKFFHRGQEFADEFNKSKPFMNTKGAGFVSPGIFSKVGREIRRKVTRFCYRDKFWSKRLIESCQSARNQIACVFRGYILLNLFNYGQARPSQLQFREGKIFRTHAKERLC